MTGPAKPKNDDKPAQTGTIDSEPQKQPGETTKEPKKTKRTKVQLSVDTGNYHLVASNGDSITIMAPKAYMTRIQALVHAAWIVAIADRGEFPAILEAVQNT